MSFTSIVKALAVAALVQPSIAGYALEDDYTENFFSKFEFFTAPDPTHGFVKFVDQGTAQGMGLISSNGSSVTMGVDHTNMAPGGRSSVRLTSNKVYNQGLIILDVAHMPVGCGTWPAFWTTGPSWPNNGEIDIIEGVNDQSFNAMTLHTGPSCSIAENSLSVGKLVTSNCDVNSPDQAKNAGCSIDASDHPNTYGTGLNNIQGGVYATQWTASGISVFYFPRGSVPSDITNGKPNPKGWGMPLSQFSGGCDINNSVKNQQIVFDTTFCGDWAGNAWSSSPTCSQKSYSCTDYVANNPAAFADAYWEINSLKVYQDDGNGDSASTTDAGPEGIATSEPTVISSLAPIPASSSAYVALNNIGGWSDSNPNGQGQYKAAPAAAAPAITPAAVPTPAVAAAVPAAPAVAAQATPAAAPSPAPSPAPGTPPGGWESVTYPPGTGANLPPSAYTGGGAASAAYAYKPGSPVQEDWFEPGSKGIPEDAVQPIFPVPESAPAPAAPIAAEGPPNAAVVPPPAAAAAAAAPAAQKRRMHARHLLMHKKGAGGVGRKHVK